MCQLYAGLVDDIEISIGGHKIEGIANGSARHRFGGAGNWVIIECPQCDGETVLGRDGWRGGPRAMENIFCFRCGHCSPTKDWKLLSSAVLELVDADEA